MRKIIAITQLTLDGVMQAPGGPEEDPRGGFKHGGWAMRYCDEAMSAVLNEMMSGEFDLLLGRRTYEIFAAYWPYAGDDPIANAFNNVTKFVATRTLDHFAWAGTQRLDSEATDAVRRLKASEGPELHVWGSGELLQALIAADLVDEFRLWTVPVILGHGRHLFENRLPPRALTLVDSRRTAAGVVMSVYRPVGPLPPGAPDVENPSAAELARREKLRG